MNIAKLHSAHGNYEVFLVILHLLPFHFAEFLLVLKVIHPNKGLKSPELPSSAASLLICSLNSYLRSIILVFYSTFHK